MRSNRSRLAHGWELVRAPGVPGALIAGFVRPAIRAVPSAIAARLGGCRVTVVSRFDDPARTSQWSDTSPALEISVAADGGEQHDVAIDLLVCLGQVLWGRISRGERAAFWKLLDAEISAGVPGEIDEDALAAKRLLLASRANARSVTLLEAYGEAAFAATAAEYVHSLWHDVTVRVGAEHLPPEQLRRRLKLLERWFPPDPGYRLFPARR
jgi:hypothetical protein